MLLGILVTLFNLALGVIAEIGVEEGMAGVESEISFAFLPNAFFAVFIELAAFLIGVIDFFLGLGIGLGELEAAEETGLATFFGFIGFLRASFFCC